MRSAVVEAWVFKAAPAVGSAWWKNHLPTKANPDAESDFRRWGGWCHPTRDIGKRAAQGESCHAVARQVRKMIASSAIGDVRRTLVEYPRD